MAPSTPPPPRRLVFAALTMASTASVVMSARTISIRVMFGIPEGADKAQAREDGPHLPWLRPARVRLQARGVPGARQAPEPRDGHERTQRRGLVPAPGPHLFFRPEEEHPASGEDDVLPPPEGRDGAVEQPVGG